MDVSHVDARQVDDLRVIGSGFDAYEGHMIRVLVTHRAPTYGLGEAPIEAGAFDILLPGVLGDYTGIAVHVDRIRDNACNPDDEFIWQMTTGPGPGDTVWEVTPDTLRVFEQVGPCSLNGIFDLTLPLPCPLVPPSPKRGAENPYAPCPMDEPFDNTCPIENSTCSSLRGCEPPCDTTDACPTPQSGNATPYCNFGICVLECDSEHGCPDGMLCSTGWCNYERP